MFILDILMILQIKLLLKVKKRESFSDVKWSAFLFSSFIVSQFLSVLILIYCTLSSSELSYLIKNNIPMLWFLTVLGTPFPLYFRYYKGINDDLLIWKYENLSKWKKQFMKVVLLILIIAIPLMSFLLYRTLITPN